MTVDGKTGVRTIVGFERTYRAVDHIAQRNYGKSAEDLMKDKIPDEVIRTAKKEIAQEVLHRIHQLSQGTQSADRSQD